MNHDNNINTTENDIIMDDGYSTDFAGCFMSFIYIVIAFGIIAAVYMFT